MTDAQATAALLSAFDDPAALRRQLKLNRNGVGPGHFGWLNTADDCDDATCMAKNVAGASGACYSDAGVSLAIGNKNAVEPYFDTRFDIYNQDPPLASPSAAPPAVNVRKGYLPGHKSNAVDWCSATPASGSSLYYTYPSNRTVGAATQNSPTLTDVANPIGIADGEPVVDSGGVFASTADNPVSGLGRQRLDGHGLGAPASETQASDGLTIEWTTSGLPEDVSFPEPWRRRGQRPVGLRQLLGHQSSPRAIGRGRWSGARRRVRRSGADDASAAIRFTDMKSAQGSKRGRDRRLVGKKWLGEQRPTGSAGLENPGGPFPDRERRAVLRQARGASAASTPRPAASIGAIWSCRSSTVLLRRRSAISRMPARPSKTPVAAFAKFFMTQPYTALKDGNLYGEITGTPVPADNVKIFHLVQLYR